MAFPRADRLVLPAEPGSVRTAREAVRAYVGALGAGADLRDPACLLVSETVTNALVHGCPPPATDVTLGLSIGGN